MRKTDVTDKVKLGVFIGAALLILTVFIFYIGSSNYKIISGIKITGIFKDVSGLRHGSMIRFSGVNIGTVDEIEIVSDSAIKVIMVIDDKSSKFIKRDSKAKISTEGLLGSKFISIFSGSKGTPKIQEGEEIESIEPLDFDNMLSDFNQSGIHTRNITSNLDNITKKIDRGVGTLGTLISDKEILKQVERMITSFQTAGVKTTLLTLKISDIADSLKIVGNNSVQISENLILFTDKLNNDSSSLGKAITDTSMAKKMDRALFEVSSTAQDVKLTSVAIRNNWFIRHFGKKDKKGR